MSPAAAPVPADLDYQPDRFAIRSRDLAPAGRHQMRLAEQQMPGLMSLRAALGPDQPLAGARISGCLHMTVQTAVLVETLTALGAEVRWASCNIFSTQDEAAAAVVMGPAGDGASAAVFAWKGESLEAYWWAVMAALDWPDGGPDLIVDDGADASNLLLAGAEFERLGKSAPSFIELAGSAEGQLVQQLIIERAETQPGWWPKAAAHLGGASEETTTGVHRLAAGAARPALAFPVLDVNDAVSQSKCDNIDGSRRALPE
ncbi:MAG: adenosylhomocysteinase, partial [Bifidobacteriaceae bacterium]|nr:adenosylhomocysteinase [Bifidobacteriaceae bacterium]